MQGSVITVIMNVVLVAWPLLYLMLWQEFGYIIPREMIRMDTLFCITRDKLWADICRVIRHYVCIPMGLLNALAYAAMYKIFHGTSGAGENILLIYLFIFGGCFNYIYMSIILCKHGFTKQEKSTGFKMTRVTHLLMTIFQFVFLDGYILATAKLNKQFSMTEFMNQFGLIGYVLELGVLAACIFIAKGFLKMAEKLFFSREFPL